MTLQFNPGAYGSIYENNQNRNAAIDQQNKQMVADSISSIPQSIIQAYQQQKQDRLNQLLTGLKFREQGIDPANAMNWVNTGKLPLQQQDSSGMNTSSIMPNFQPQGQMASAGMPDTGFGEARNQPSPVPTSSPVISAWNNHPDKGQFAPVSSQRTFSSLFQGPQVDVGDVINRMVKGDYSGWQNASPYLQQKIQSDPRYKVLVKPKDNLNFNQAKLIIPTLEEKSFNDAYPNGIPKEHLAMMSKPTGLSTMNTSTYATAPADDQRLARNLVDGRIRPSDIGYRDRGRIVSLASEYADMAGKPFQSFGGDVNAGMAKSLAYGKIGQNVISFNTALGHIGDAEDAYQKVGNTDQRWLNTPINVLKKQTNDPNIIALDLNLNAVAGELATAFKGSSGTDQEIGHFSQILTDNLTPAQAHAAMQKAGQLLNSRINALQSQQSSVRNSNGGQRQLLSPHGSEVMNQLNSGNQQPIIQRNKRTGQIRQSFDGGQTWQIQQ